MSDARQQAEDHYYAALDLMAEGQLEQAVARYREALLSDPTFTEAMHGMARTLQDLERFAQARWPHYLDRDQDDQNTHAINGHLAFMDSRYLTIPRQNFSNLLYFFLSTMALKRS